MHFPRPYQPNGFNLHPSFDPALLKYRDTEITEELPTEFI